MFGPGLHIALYQQRLGFTPADVSTLEFWVDASDLSTLTIDGSNNVSQWDDKSGNGNHATQGIAADQPLLVMNELNNHPILRFDGVSEWMDIPDNWQLGSIWELAVGKFGSSAAVQSITGSYGGERFHIQRLSAGGFRWQVGFNPAVTISTAGDTNWHLFELKHIGSDVEAFLDGTSQGTGSKTQTGDVDNLGIGSVLHGDGAFLNGDIAEIIMASAPTANEITNIRQYISRKYGMTIA